MLILNNINKKKKLILKPKLVFIIFFIFFSLMLHTLRVPSSLTVTKFSPFGNNANPQISFVYYLLGV